MKRMLPPTLLLLCLVAMIVLRLGLPLGTMLPSPYNLLGLLPLVVGLVINVSADRLFARVGTNVKTFDEPGRLVTDGWFRFSRNPMYLGFVLILVGVWIVLDAFSPVLGVVVFAAAADRWYIPYEEKMMSRFGPAYEDYRRQVRRWI